MVYKIAYVEGPDEHGSLYVDLSPRRAQVIARRTLQATEVEVLLDYDAGGRLVGIEILGVDASP